MHAPFLGLKVNRPSNSLQENFEGKGQALTPDLPPARAGEPMLADVRTPDKN
jgi:hypothetical protein